MKGNVFICICMLFAGFLACSSIPSDEKLRQSIDTILETVDADINYSMKHGVVTLIGTVDSEEVKNTIEQLAKSVKNIRMVINQIKVKPVIDIHPDDILHSAISAALQAEGFDNIKIAIDNGEVTLLGDIKREDLTRVMEIVNELKPKNLISEFKIM